MMNEGMEGVWKEVWRDPESRLLDAKPKPIRGFLRNPDYRSARDPLTGKEGYSTIYEAKKRKQTLIHQVPVKPIQSLRKSDYELVYRGDKHKSDDRTDHRRRTNDIRKKTSDIILKEQRFREETLNYMRQDREYKKDIKTIVNAIEKEHAKTRYNPWGKPGGGAPGNSTRRTKELELKERTNNPTQQNPLRYPYEIFRARTRQDDIPPTNPKNYAPGGDNECARISSEDFLTNFGKPGGGAPCKITKRTLLLNDRFESTGESRGEHWLHNEQRQLDPNTTSFIDTKLSHTRTAKKAPIMRTETVSGPRVIPIGSNESNSKPKSAPTKPVMANNSDQVVNILFPGHAINKVKGTPSNPTKIVLPRYSKEKLPPWEKTN